MDLANTVEVLKVVLCLDGKDLNEQAKQLRCSIEVDQKELKNLRENLKKYIRQVTTQYKQSVKKFKVAINQADKFVKRGMSDNLSPSEIEQRAKRINKAVSRAQQIIEQAIPIADVLNVTFSTQRLKQIFGLAQKFNRSFGIQSLLERRLDERYARLFIGGAGFIPVVGKVISFLDLIHTATNMSSKVKDFNSAVRAIGQFYIAKIQFFLYHNYIIPYIKLVYSQYQEIIKVRLNYETARIDDVVKELNAMAS